MENLEEMDKLLDMCELQKLNHENSNNWKAHE
jgi:hypothetical protein